MMKSFGGSTVFTVTNHSFVGDAGFTGSDDFTLTSSSPLIDAGDPAAPDAGRHDRADQPRDRAGDVDCTPRRDIGAYEYVRKAPFAKASGTGATAGEPATFDASASCDPGGDPLQYEWSFDDGGTATGANPGHAFTDAGTHEAEVTVSNGIETDSAIVQVTIDEAPPAPGPDPDPDPDPSGTGTGTGTGTGGTSTGSTSSTSSATGSDAPPAGATSPLTVTPATTPAGDRIAPRIAKLRAARRGGKVRIRFTLTEAAKVVVRVGRRRRTVSARAGRTVLTLRARGKRAKLVATDAAG